MKKTVLRLLKEKKYCSAFIFFLLILAASPSPLAAAQQSAESTSFFPDGDIGESFKPPTKLPPSYPSSAPARTPEKTAPAPLPTSVLSKELPAPSLTPAVATSQTHTQFVAERSRLQRMFQQEVTASLPLAAKLNENWTKLALQQLRKNHYNLNKNQVILIVDRNPHIQKMAVMAIDADNNTLDTIGVTSVSTGAKSPFGNSL